MILMKNRLIVLALKHSPFIIISIELKTIWHVWNSNLLLKNICLCQQVKQLLLNFESKRSFAVFKVFDFSMRTKLKNLGTSQTSNFLKENNCIEIYKFWKKFLLFWVFDSRISIEIENLKITQIPDFLK